MSKKKSKKDESVLKKDAEVKKVFKMSKIIKPPFNLSTSSSSSSQPPPSAKPKTGPQLISGKLSPFLVRIKEKKEPSVQIGSKDSSTKGEQMKKRLQRPTERSSKSQHKLSIKKNTYPHSVDLTKKEATHIKTAKLGPRSISKIEQKSSSFEAKEPMKSKEFSHEKCNQYLIQANEKIKKLEEQLKKEKLNAKKSEEMHQGALKESEMVKEALDEKIGIISKLNESVQDYEKKVNQNVTLINSLKRENEDVKKQIEKQQMVSEKREAELNRQIQELNEKLETVLKAETETVQAYQNQKDELINEKKELERKIKSLEDEKRQGKNQSVEIGSWLKDSNEYSQLDLLSKENQVLKEEISQVKKENEKLATRCETALIEKHFMNEQLVDAVDQLEIDFEEKSKLKEKLDSFKSQLTEVNKLIIQEKEFTLKNYQMLDDIKKENSSLKNANKELEQSRIRVEKELQKAVNEKKVLFEKKNKCKVDFQKLLKEFEKQKEGLEQIRKSLQNAIQNFKSRNNKQMDISKVLAIYQSIEDHINKIDKQSDLKQYNEKNESISGSQTVPLDYKACLQWLKEQLAEKDIKLESLNLYLSQVLGLPEDEKVKQSVAMEEARLERSLIDENVIAALKDEKDELSKALEDKKKINHELKEALKFREEEYEKQVKLTNDLREYLDQSENSLYQIREEYKSLLRANEGHNKSMEDNINHKIFLENQIKMLEDKQQTLNHQIEKLLNMVEQKHDQETSQPNHVAKFESHLNQQVEALKNEKSILINDLKELKKEDSALVELIEKDRIKCEEISINLGNARKRLSEILEIDKDKGYLNFLLEGQDDQVIKFKKEVVQKLLEQSRLAKAFEKVLKEIISIQDSIQDSIPEEPIESKFDSILQRLKQETHALKTKLGEHKKSYHTSSVFLKSMVKNLQSQKGTKKLKQLGSKSIVEDLKTRLTYMKKRIQEIEDHY